MAFGYEYWMVYLPEDHSTSFLLFVSNPAGSTKLRDYSRGKETVLGQPDVASVFGRTQYGRTRFEVEPHKVTDVHHWVEVTAAFNRKHLKHVASTAPEPKVPFRPTASGPGVSGRAARGSQRQLQDYVNLFPDRLSSAVLDVLPPRLRELGATVRWVSPLAAEDYREYRDAEFLERVGSGDCAGELAKFWPAGGPSWDALGIVSDPAGRIIPGVLLVEAKSHLAEIRGPGTKASAGSLERIRQAVEKTKCWCGASAPSDWLGPLYQSANRLCHLYFFLQEIRRPAWLINLYFLHDPIGPADVHTWQEEIVKTKAELGLRDRVPNAYEVFLPALDDGQRLSPSNIHTAQGGGISVNRAVPNDPGSSKEQMLTLTFKTWSQRWIALADYSGPTLRDAERRIDQLVDLWKEPVPGEWKRGPDPQLLDGTRYRRGDLEAPHPGEHTIEHEILVKYFTDMGCLGGRLVDGINALPLSRDASGGREGNVEADLALLATTIAGYSMILGEVKAASNDPWYAAVENLRQMKLASLSPEVRLLFRRRNPSVELPADLPLVGLVIAPREFYTQSGQKSGAVGPAEALLRRFRVEFGLDLRLAVWNISRRSLEALA